MRLLITHGLRRGGVAPRHTAKGLVQLASLPKLEGVTRVVVGTGARFVEIYWALVENGKLDQSMPVAYSPFCGGAEGFDAPNVVLTDGSLCDMSAYIGIGNTAAFDAWKFIEEQPDGTLFLAGGELMIALGCVNPPKAALFALEPEKKGFKFIVHG